MDFYAVLDELVELLRARGRVSYRLSPLADAYGAFGKIEEGLHSLEEALEWVQRNDERLYAAEVHRIKGNCCFGRMSLTPWRRNISSSRH
jgi:hypothetical protein